MKEIAGWFLSLVGKNKIVATAVFVALFGFSGLLEWAWPGNPASEAVTDIKAGLVTLMNGPAEVPETGIIHVVQ